MSTKSPAFQWYPRDYLVDENTVVMTLEEEGAYRRLLDYCWLEGSLPDDMGALSTMCKGIGRKRMEKLWMRISKCFKKRGERWIHQRLEKERRVQAAYKKAKSAAGRKGAEAKHGKGNRGTATSLPVAKSSSSSASSSSITTTAFAEVWAVCARGSKARALDQYAKAVPTKVAHGELLEAWRRHVAAASEPRYVKHLERWIRDERWLEAAPSPNGTGRGSAWADRL